MCKLLHRISDHVVQSVTSPSFVAKVTTCGLAGWQLVDTLVVGVAALVTLTCLVCLAIFVVQRNRKAHAGYDPINDSPKD